MSTSYAILRVPAATSGTPSQRLDIAAPARDGLMDEETVRVVLVRPAAAMRSPSSTMAMTYDCRVGTSIWDRDCLHRSRPTAPTGVGARATPMRKTFDGMWL